MQVWKIVMAVLAVLRSISPELKSELHQLAEQQKAKAVLTPNPADDVFWGLVDALLS